MSQVTGLPDIKPEGALLITAPLSSVKLDFETKTWTLGFGPGEFLEVDSAVIGLGALSLHFMACEQIVGHIAEKNLVWADPDLVQAQIDAARAEGV